MQDYGWSEPDAMEELRQFQVKVAGLELEIIRLQEENMTLKGANKRLMALVRDTEPQEQIRYEQQRNEENVALNDYEMKRLRGTIKREAEMHASILGGGACACEICRIAREGR